jgi:hypothetical protein
MSREEAELHAIDRGILTERTILGMGASGVLSLADLEANYEGMRFLRSLCEGDTPLLVTEADAGWRLRGPFDFRAWVTPEWDESYQPCVYTKSRWKRVRPILVGYCPMLQDPGVQQQRRAYAARDRVTPTEERVRELVLEGKLPDPEQFSIEDSCSAEPE